MGILSAAGCQLLGSVRGAALSCLTLPMNRIETEFNVTIEDVVAASICLVFAFAPFLCELPDWFGPVLHSGLGWTAYALIAVLILVYWEIL